MLAEVDGMTSYAHGSNGGPEGDGLRSTLAPEHAARLLDAVAQAVIVTSPEGIVLSWNLFAEQLYGWTAAEATGRNILELTPSTEAADAAIEVMERLEAGSSWSGRFPVRRKDSSRFLAFVTDAPVFDDDGHLVAIVGVSHDVTEQSWNEETLRRSEERLRFALEAGRMGTWTWDVQTGRVTWDEAMEACYGLASGTFDGTLDGFLALVHPDDRDWVFAAIGRARDAGEDLAFEHRARWPDGSVHWLEGRGRSLRDGAGAITGMVGVGIDIDERKQLEQARRETGELRAARDRRAIEVLQDALIRPVFPSTEEYDIAARYLAADETAGVGGDWYDAFITSDRRIVLTIGDVSGHGLGAARSMAKLRHAARAYAWEDPSPIVTLERLDAFARHFFVDDEFATIEVLVLDPARGTVDIASAGHPPPLLISDRGCGLIEVDNSPPAGLGRGRQQTRPTRVELKAGDALLSYTDGLIERRGETLDEGIWRLTQATPPRLESAAQVCAAAIAGCIGSRRREDDVCVLALRRRG